MSTFIPMHQRAKVKQRPSFVCSSLRFFFWRCSSIFPCVILVPPLASFFVNYVHCKLVDACSWRPQQVSRIDIGERGDWPVSVCEDRQSSIALATAEHLQPLLNDLLAVSLVTGKRKMWRKLSVGRNMKNGEAVANLARLSMKASAKDVSGIAERKDVLWSPICWPKTNQWSPVGIIMRN